MGYRVQFHMALICSAFVVSGCASVHSNPLALWSKKSPEKKEGNEEKPKSGEELFVSKTKKKSSETSDSTSSKRESSSRENSRGGARSSRSDAPEHDADTLAYIDKELQDASPEERDQFERELKGAAPDMVKMILKARRMGLNHQREQLASKNPSRSAGGDSGATDSGLVRNERDRGLGGATPWGQSQTTQQHTSAQQPQTAAGGGQSGPIPAGYDRPGNTVANPHLPQANPQAQDQQPGYGQSAQTAAGRTLAQQTPPADGSAPGQAQGLGGLIPGRYDAHQPPGIANGTPNVQRANHSAGRPATIAGSGDLTAAGGFPVDPRAASQSSWHEYLQRLIAATEAEVATLRPGTTDAERQFYTEKQVYLRMLYLMSGQQERALQGIAGLEPADQEFWQQTFWGIANYFDSASIPLGPDRATQTVSQFTTAVLRLQEKANLELRNATFCQKISSFGSYERFPRDEFSPGQPVLLYAEVVNFHSEPTADGQYRTILKSSLDVRKPGPQGELIEQFQFPATEDICRNHRRDYFHSYEFTIPAKLPLGPHVLKLTVEDQLSRKVATYSLNFTVK